jgi:hypothetical protein
MDLFAQEHKSSADTASNKRRFMKTPVMNLQLNINKKASDFESEA